MKGDFNTDLERELQEPESAAYFYEAQQESLDELLRCGVVQSADFTSGSNNTIKGDWVT